MPAQYQNKKKKNRKHGKPTSTRDPQELPKKPHNPFILYKMDTHDRFIKDCEEYVATHKDDPDGVPHDQRKAFTYASKLLGNRWRNESASVKKKYNDLALEKSLAYNLEVRAIQATRKLKARQMKGIKKEAEEAEELGEPPEAPVANPINLHMQHGNIPLDYTAEPFSQLQAPNPSQEPVDALSFPTTQRPLAFHPAWLLGPWFPPSYLQYIPQVSDTSNNLLGGYPASLTEALQRSEQALNYDYVQIPQLNWNQLMSVGNSRTGSDPVDFTGLIAQEQNVVSGQHPSQSSFSGYENNLDQIAYSP